ncbi:MAG: hypothetical protein K2L23_07810 [Odoribacter sp.]|nr:hypothetical protein [Odoribacter sp.]
MHRFIEYISDLLFLHDCVIIPDFGGFICNYKSAYIDEESGLICPPTKDILFNRNLTHNDGLLVNWIACKENITYEKATVQVTLFCEELKIKLNQRQRVVFGDIGVFYTDRRFNIIFEPDKNNFFAEAYGMAPLNVPKLEMAPVKPVVVASSTPPSSIPDVATLITLETSGNVLHRLFKYGLAVAVMTGIIIIAAQFVIYYNDEYDNSGILTNHFAIQPDLPMISASKVKCNNVIAPVYDYVDYDPVNDLGW